MGGWKLRETLNRIHGMDMVPSPDVIKAAMHACRKANEYSIAVRYLEAIQWKCGPQKKVTWPYLQKEIQPTLDELGILTPEAMAMPSPNCIQRMSTICTLIKLRFIMAISKFICPTLDQDKNL